MSHLQREINEQPEVARRLLDHSMGDVRRIAAAIRDFDPAFVMIAARGTSDNAGRYGQYLLGISAGLAVGLATPSIHTLYDARPNLRRALVIGISQSGQAADVGRVITDARQQGALTVTITNDPNSPLASAAEHHLALHAGDEISVAATKTYTAQLTAIAMIATALADSADMLSALSNVPRWMQDTLSLSESIPAWAERYRYMERFATIGRSLNYCTAFEVSLKIKELCYLTGVEYSEADFRHGPIAMVQSGFPVISVAPTGKTLPAMVDLLGKLRERKAENIVISNDDHALSLGHKTMKLPANIPEWLSPLVAVIPGQVLAMNLALAKGHPVDRPEGLTKVTITQ
jgi:glucosamine--fructose-6-phosphate aminotransferase (isomerizing)